MWIEKLEIEGFRRLAGKFEFSPSLTVVVGDNEAGKSSLHEALIRALFGFSKVERRRSRGNSPLERRAPWDGRPYRLACVLRNAEQALRVEWDFAAHSVRLTDELAQDISDRVRGKGDEVALGEFLIGVGLDDFRQVCCIDQDALLAVQHSPSLGVALQEAVANIAGDTPVEHAIESLNNFLRTVVGARVDTLKPSPAGRLTALLREGEELRRRVRAATEAARSSLASLVIGPRRTRRRTNCSVIWRRSARWGC